MVYKLTGDGITIEAGSPDLALKLFKTRRSLRSRPPRWLGPRELETLLLLETMCTFDSLVRLTGRRARDLKVSIEDLKEHKLIDEIDGFWYRTIVGDFTAASIDNPIAKFSAPC